jgi:hypothetical protein
VIEDVFWGDNEPEQRPDLVRHLTDAAAGSGARVAIVPLLGYGDTEPFRAAGFRPTQRLVWMYLSIWNGGDDLQPLGSCYLDVL